MKSLVFPRTPSTVMFSLFSMAKQTESKNKLGISSFGVSVTTLEDVFIKVGEGYEHTVDEV